MKQPAWKLFIPPGEFLPVSVSRVWPDGKLESVSLEAEEYLAWLAEGNEPLPADEDK